MLSYLGIHAQHQAHAHNLNKSNCRHQAHLEALDVQGQRLRVHVQDARVSLPEPVVLEGPEGGLQVLAPRLGQEQQHAHALRHHHAWMHTGTPCSGLLLLIPLLLFWFRSQGKEQEQQHAHALRRHHGWTHTGTPCSGLLFFHFWVFRFRIQGLEREQQHTLCIATMPGRMRSARSPCLGMAGSPCPGSRV